MTGNSAIVQQFETLSQLAVGGKLRRFLHSPLKYLNFILINKIQYRAFHKAKTVRARLFFGDSMLVALPAGTDIYLTGGKTHDSELRLARFMMRHLHEGDVFYDVGAHFGYFSLLASHLTGAAGRVCAFEPSSLGGSLLQKNASGHANLFIENKAVSDRIGTLTFYEFPALHSEYNALDVAQFEHEAWYKKNPAVKRTVDVTTLDHFIETGGPIPNIIKIDVEGAEHSVMLGGTMCLQRHRPLIVMEYLCDSRHNEGHRRAGASLAEWGYQPFSIDDTGSLQPLPDIEAYMRERGLDSDNIVFRKNAAT